MLGNQANQVSSMPATDNALMESREGNGSNAAPRPGLIPLKPVANIDFAPIPTNPGKSRKLKINVLLDATIFVAGGTIHGRLVLTCSSSRAIRLGLIEVQLQGYEEVKDRDLAACQSFLSSSIIFQGEKTPPSNAVRGPKEDGFWQANKGKTTFPFAFRLPADAPSSFEFQNLACLKYVVTGVVHYEENGQFATMFKSKDAFVLEHWKSTHPDLADIVTDEAVGQVFMGGNGLVTLHGAIRTRLSQSGSDVYVETRVKNESRRRVQGMKVQLIRKLVMLQNSTKRGPLDTKVMTEPVAEATFRDKDKIYDPGEDRSNVLHVHIPTYARTVSNTALAEIAVSVQVTLSMGMLSKDILIELPIDVCHAASVSPPPAVDLSANLHPYQYNMVNEQYISPDGTSSEFKYRTNCISPTRVHRPESPPPGGRRLPWSDDEGDDDDEEGCRSPSYDDAGSPDRGRTLTASSPTERTISPNRIPISPAQGPAAPTVYVSAAERSRYLTGIPPPQRYRTSRAFSPARESIYSGEYTNEGFYIEKVDDNLSSKRRDFLTNASIPLLNGSLNVQPKDVSQNVTSIRPPRPLPEPQTVNDESGAARAAENFNTSTESTDEGKRNAPQHPTDEEAPLRERKEEREKKEQQDIEVVKNCERHQSKEKSEQGPSGHVSDEKNRGRTREKEDHRHQKKHYKDTRALFEEGQGSSSKSNMETDDKNRPTASQPLSKSRKLERAISPRIQALMNQIDQQGQ